MLTITKNRFKLESQENNGEYIVRFYDGEESIFDHAFKNHEELMKADSSVLTKKIPPRKYVLSTLVEAYFAVEDTLTEYKRRMS
jgi:hypothetical protein